MTDHNLKTLLVVLDNLCHHVEEATRRYRGMDTSDRLYILKMVGFKNIREEVYEHHWGWHD